jgi:hypothetical protein
MDIPRQFPLKSIRKNCLECIGNQYSLVKFCHLTYCPLWFLRFGKMPQTIIKKGGTEWEALFDPENFQEGGKFGPDKDISSMKLRKRRLFGKNPLL